MFTFPIFLALPAYITAAETAGIDGNEEITSLPPYVYYFLLVVCIVTTNTLYLASPGMACGKAYVLPISSFVFFLSVLWRMYWTNLH